MTGPRRQAFAIGVRCAGCGDGPYYTRSGLAQHLNYHHPGLGPRAKAALADRSIGWGVA